MAESLLLIFRSPREQDRMNFVGLNAARYH